MEARRSSALAVALALAAAHAFAQGTPPIAWVGAGHIHDHALCVSPDGASLATASFEDNTIKLWRVADGALLSMYDTETGWGPFPVLPIATTPDGSRFVYGRGDATVIAAINPWP